MKGSTIFLLSTGLLLSLAFSLWRTPSSLNKAGNELYKEGAYEEALAQYTEAKAESPDAEALDYNIGNSLYKLDRFEQSSTAYQNVLQSADRGLQQKAFYNLGNSYFRQGLLMPAIESYQTALLLDASDHESKRNLEIALKRLKELEEQQAERRPSDGKEEEEQQQEQQMDTEDQPTEDQAQPHPQPAQMTPEETLRLLQALEEQEKATLQQIQRQQQAESPGTSNDW